MAINSKGQFLKGSPPWNKGIKTGIVPKTAFKKGQEPWNKDKPHLAIRGNKHYRWQGGFWIDAEGYRMIEVKRLGKRYRIPEHRLVMEKHLGRKLLTTEDIHHLDHNKLNNIILNLVIMTKRDHALLHASLKREVV